MLSLAWDCLPLIAIICPMIVDFFLYRTKVQGAQIQKNVWVKLQMVISVSLAVAAAGIILSFFAAILYLSGFKGAFAVTILISPLTAAVFYFYERITQVRGRKITQGKDYIPISHALAVVLGGSLLVPLIFSFDFSIISTGIGTPIAIYAFYKMATLSLINQKRAKVTIRLFLAICLAAVGFIVVFPPTNVYVSLLACHVRIQAMDHFIGASTGTFIAVFGQPDSQGETSLDYFNIPSYSYPDVPDNDIAVIIKDDKIKACISH
jgi:hypothetical protein